LSNNDKLHLFIGIYEPFLIMKIPIKRRPRKLKKPLFLNDFWPSGPIWGFLAKKLHFDQNINTRYPPLDVSVFSQPTSI